MQTADNLVNDSYQMSQKGREQTTVYVNSKHQLLYVDFDEEAGERLFNETLHRHELHDNNKKSIHLTTEGAFDRYLQKRKEVPHMVVIYSTIKELEAILEKYNLFI